MWRSSRAARLAQAQAPAQAPPPAGEPYQHIPLPAQLPKGVSVKDAQHLQALIDDYNLQEPLVTTKVKDNVYMVRGGPGRNVPNSGFIVGKTSVIIVGNKNSKEAEEALLAEIAKVTPKPVKTVIILHSEHESGVGFLPAGLTIIAHENAKKEMEVSTARDKVPVDRFPTKTVGKDETMTIDGVRVRLLHWGPGYTGGDLIVFFPAQKVVFAGDLVVSDFPLAGTFVDHPGKRHSGRVARKYQGDAYPELRLLRSGPRCCFYQKRREDETGIRSGQVGQDKSDGRSGQVAR